MRPVLLAVAALLLLATAPARADDAAVLYDPQAVTTVDLSLSAEAQDALLAAPKDYVPAGLTLTLPDGARLGPFQVGLKTKGNATLLPITDKASLKVKFAHVVKGQKVLGLKGMTLNNMLQDDSAIRETLTYGLFRAAGVPASRTGYAYVRLNGVGKGLYLDLEPYDSVSLARLYPTAGTRHLFEGESSADFAPDRRGPFSVEEGDEDDVSDLDAMIAAAQRTTGWSAGMAGVADLAELRTMWATEDFVAHFDGYGPNHAWYAPNNYYAHSDAQGRFTLLPSGVDQTLQHYEKQLGTGTAVLISRCRAEASCWTAYQQALRAVSKTASTAQLGQRAQEAEATVARWRPCAAQRKPATATWRDQVDSVHRFLKGRRQEVATYLGDGANGAPTPIQTPDGAPAEGTACPAPMTAQPPTPTPTPTPTPSPTPTASPIPTVTPDGAAPGATAGSGDAPAAPPAEPPAGGVAGTVASGARSCLVPALRGRTLPRARTLLRASACRPGTVIRRGDGRRVKRGGWRVRASRPGAGARRAGGSRVVLLAVPKR